jgi:hypothetical protein
MFDPAHFAAVLAVLTALEYPFMLRIGWRPLEDPAAPGRAGPEGDNIGR